MFDNRNIPYYILAVIIFVALKFAFAAVDNQGLLFLLAPADTFTGLLTGSRSVFLPERGFYHETLHILISKSCSGHSFLLLCFLVFSYLTVKHFDKPLHKALALPASLCGAYVLTLFVNTSRIFVSVAAQYQITKVFPYHQHLIHESIGILTNLSFLVLAYYAAEKFLEYRGQVQHGRSTES